MKKIIYIFFISCIHSFSLFGQTDCINNVSTNHENPANSALPNHQLPLSFLNNFDWVNHINTNGGYFDAYTNLFGMVYNGSAPLTAMNNILNLVPNQFHYSYITDGPVPLTENGWELMLVNLGYFPDDQTPIVNNNLANLPYIVLYNRYSGVIRVFVRLDLTNNANSNAVEVILEFEDQVLETNGMLRVYEGTDQALNEPTDIVTVKTLATMPTANGYWASADFQVAYDPCICYYPSKLKIKFGQITSSNDRLNDYDVPQKDLLVNNTNSFTVAQSIKYLAGYNNLGPQAEEGLLFDKHLNHLIGVFQAKLEDVEAELNSLSEISDELILSIGITKMTKKAVELIETSGQIPINYNWSSAIGSGTYNLIIDHVGNILKPNSEIDIAVLFDEFKTVYSLYGNTLITNNFEEAGLRSAPTLPTVTLESMSFGGSSQASQLNSIEFYTPGTYGSTGTGAPLITDPLKYPVYNEALGIFALLRTPKIKISKDIKPKYNNYGDLEQVGVIYENLSGDDVSGELKVKAHQAWSEKYQFQLLEDIKFVINDAVDIKDYDIQAAFNFEATPALTNTETLPSDVDRYVYCFQEPELYANIEYTNTNMSNHSKLVTSATNKPYLYYKDVFPYATEADLMAGSVKDKVDIQTPFIPIDAAKSYIGGFGLNTEIITIRSHEFDENELLELDYTKGNEITGGISFFFQHLFHNLFDTEYNLYQEEPFTYLHNEELTPPYAYASTCSYHYNLKVELKLIVDIEFNTLNSDGEPNRTTMVLTYPLKAGDIVWEDEDLDPWLNESRKNLTFDNVEFNGQPVDGCWKNYGTYYCQAWNNIDITGIIDPGSYEVKMMAGNEIIVSPESEISPEIELSIKPVISDFSQPNPQASLSYVQEFCHYNTGQANAYQANEAGTRVKAILDSIKQLGNDKTENSSSDVIDLFLYPNPAQSNVNIKIVNPEEVEIKILSLYDVSGRLILDNIMMSETGVYSLDISQLDHGVYFIKMRTEYGSKTKQLIVN